MSAPASQSTVRAPRYAVALSVFLVILALSFGLAACAQGSAASAGGSARDVAGQPDGEPAAPADGGEGKGQLDGGPGSLPLADLAERKIIYRRTQTSFGTETRESDFEPAAFN
jgi:hypothetical protein